MYSGLLPRGLTEDDLSSSSDDDEDAPGEDVEDKGKKKVGDERGTSSAERNTVSVWETQATRADSDADRDSPTCSVAGVSQEMWQFQDQRKKLEEMKTMKVPRKRKRRRRHHKKGDSGADREGPAGTREYQEARETHWNELKQYFGVNERFHPAACSNPLEKSGLEKSIEGAIAEGDVAKAEEMSDRLATRELAVNIAQAADCRDFVRNKQEEEALREIQKTRKKLAWGFEAKQRWETKSNMGFI
ncbi:protein FAM204A isoform X2 [Brachionichthys hirsutus]|uniref:protein FAM204A isoform X2 n=1 Tax=Brachionichthys hirsutus TaxID=412623 RepID=UPI003605001A